jgi:hypothetical protein
MNCEFSGQTSIYDFIYQKSMTVPQNKRIFSLLFFLIFFYSYCVLQIEQTVLFFDSDQKRRNKNSSTGKENKCNSLSNQQFVPL